MLLTVVLVPLMLSAETKASNSSFPDVVEKAAVVIVVAAAVASLETFASIEMAVEVAVAKLTPVILAALTVTDWLAGVKVAPVLVGVTV
jgi:hypothetical protein